MKKDLWKKRIEGDMKTITDRLGEMDDKLKDIENLDKSNIQEILTALKELRESKKDDSRWKGLGMFLLGGISFIFIILLIGAFAS